MSTTEFNYKQSSKTIEYRNNYDKAMRKKCTLCSVIIEPGQEVGIASDIYCMGCAEEITDGGINYVINTLSDETLKSLRL